METVTLTYKRLPDRVNHFQQRLLYMDEQVIVTSQRVKPSSPIIQKGETVLDADFATIWFVFTGLWFDVGRVYNLKDEWTGYYCDIMTPVERRVDARGALTCFEITDLFLDLWINRDGSYEVQDEDEFAAAVDAGAIDGELARSARSALSGLIVEVEAGGIERRLAEVMDRSGFPDVQEAVAALP